MCCSVVWKEQISKGGFTPTDKRDKLEKHLCRGNMHLCCHLCRFACKQVDYVSNFGRDNLIVDCMKVCDRFELR